MRGDFEIFPIRCNDGKVRYAFNVEYYGYYVCESMDAAEKKVVRVRQQGKQRLEEIDRQNKEYYKKLEKRQNKLLASLKEAKCSEKEHRVALAKEVRKRKQIIRVMIFKGYSNEEILAQHPDFPLRSITHIRGAIEKASFQENQILDT